MKEERIIKLCVTSVVLFVIGIVTSYIGLVDITDEVKIDLNQEATFENTLLLMQQMLSNSMWFWVMLLSFMGSAIYRPAVFMWSVLASMFLFVGWLCMIHAHWVFLPGMSNIYETGWSYITISQHFTLTAGLIAVTMFFVGLIAHYLAYYSDYTWDDYTYRTLCP